ncbi:heptaprenyl diphosphate synthase component 1 [Sporolactobacillus sp. CPB3-1]|uniref:Heptaprenyl diphosphate synthase component 1 n=1 Tax=Sporolactobacillus mangiferae TaxID=2940498 RepID=A0ABT0MAE4_9BACL|nr:heptaprenyl diphosphate synthase component 1 [Sporolactobacillus mangiferae]MCL1631833.1 heptaprenyl diphosphate synthase component 1 [Sporolactobacillus mangiferae]
MSLNDELKLVHDQLCEELEHPYVRSILPEPVIDRDKLLIYYVLFRLSRFGTSAAECTKSVLVAEIGLNTHRNVSNISMEGITGSEATKQRQLTVLSGDFYSALYYFWLARQPNMEVIKWVAQAIQKFNVQQCTFFYPASHPNWIEMIAAIKEIESALVKKIAEQLGFTQMISYLTDFLLVKKLIFEQSAHGHESGLFYRVLHDTFDHCPERLDKTIREKKTQLIKALNRPEDERQQWRPLLNYLRNRMERLTESAEEGIY